MQQQQIGFDESKKFIREKKDFHNALERNGYVCPDIDSKFTNGDVLLAIKDKKMYCPQYEDFTPKINMFSFLIKFLCDLN